jgi:hypothetical protein
MQEVAQMGHNSREVSLTPEQLAPLIKEQIELGDLAAEQAGMPYYRKAGGYMLQAKPSIALGKFEAWCRQVTGKHESQCQLYIRAYKETVAAITNARNGRQKTATAAPRLSNTLGEIRGQPTSGRVFREWTAPVDDAVDRARVEQLRRGDEQKRKQELARRLIDIGFKVLAQELHPDKMGGSKDAMLRLNEVRNRLKQVYG